MAYTNDAQLEDKFRPIGKDAIAAFETGSRETPIEFAGSEHLTLAGPADIDDEEDDLEDDEDLDDEDADEEDDDLEDDDEEDEEDDVEGEEDDDEEEDEDDEDDDE
jgi:hypothetical protein